MGYNAWDNDLKSVVDADICIKKEKGHYLCPTPECREKGILVYLAEGGEGNHFRTMPGYKDKHWKYCDFPSQHSDGKGYRKKHFGIFNLETLIANLKMKEIKENISTEKPLDKTSNIDKLNENNDTIIDIDNLNKLYGAIIHNSLDYYITSDYKVGDICIDQRNVTSAKKYIRKPLMFFGTTNGMDYTKKILRVNCEDIDKSVIIKVCIDLDEKSYRYMKSRLKKIDEKFKGIRVAVLANFKTRKTSFTDKNGIEIPYEENYAECTAGQIKIIDRVKSQNQTTQTLQNQNL